MKYNWQQKDWRNFSYNIDELEDYLYKFIEKTGKIKGITKGLSKISHTQTTINILVSEAIKTSEIEGEFLSRTDVMSSVRNNLNINTSHENVKDIKAKGIGELVTNVQNNFKEELTKETIFKWHQQLLQDENLIEVGKWRTHQEPMQVISGAMGRTKIHFEAPASANVNNEMDHFINWFNTTSPKGKKPIKNAAIRAAIAHLYFESIHPFEDGNGRIGRAIAEKSLLQTLDSPLLISLSTSIEKEKKEYYKALEKGQRSNEITPWLHYFINLILNALDTSEAIIEFTLKKTTIFTTYQSKLNERQLKVIRRMLDEGFNGFQGGMTARKYIGITKTSKATATRDLQNLLELGVFKLLGKGRNTSYQINFDV
ncbi:Fic family protein [Tenacibaculum piscium]|uniref:Fic family protein n=1 Tax=Tenacibaculum piscium TaxID=1458515 RepID=UPI001EFB2199|nr:Fic family protein [Tenacibaculum piscium]MCG8182396.1 Fic family protein [Tenacibaculum piscium]MCG8203788.1 Fic family protein [Tenacibaculum piscium]